MRSLKSAVYPSNPNSRSVSLRSVPGRGRGVFARRNIPKGELIERAPVIVIPEKQWPDIEGSVLSDYAFDWGERDEQAVIALGYVSIYNHSYTPNAKLEQMPEELMMEVVALKDIKEGAEITINYNGDPAGRDPLWFIEPPPARRNGKRR
jgi:SET domain-containing protein